ncbi:hypothetical protein ACJMK2_023745 [Sinanodonta woodiana]|uniref:Vacuolar protein sorting-associated protein 41 homolog n=2 Tax=Sinanodonta woodiana TaxID=1069815 RepID=A0ABD3T583_SINWO
MATSIRDVLQLKKIEMIEDSSQEEDESDEETDSSEDDIEPTLKYERVTNDLSNILAKDCASCMAVHEKFIALGTHWGMLYLLDYQGNKVSDKEYNAHTTTVNQISVDENGDYIASCSDDGKVHISGLYAPENNQVINFDRPVKAVALDPLFYKSSAKQFVTGDDKLVLTEKGFFGRNKSTILHEGEGPIREIKWKGDFIAWANDRGVKVYDMSKKSRITSIAKEHDKRPDLYHCNLYWKDGRTLFVGWADRVKVCIVKDNLVRDARDLPTRYVEIVSYFTTDFYISGIVSLEDKIVILSYEKEENLEEGEQHLANRPHLRTILPRHSEYEEISNDALSIRGYQEYRCNDYHLESIQQENLFYIISPKDVVVARQRDQDDHIEWLVEHERFEEALELAIKHSRELKRCSFQEIGKQYLNALFENEEYDEAARLCVKISGKNKDFWDIEALRFQKKCQLKALAPYLPREDPTLSAITYEMVLNEFLNFNPKGFLQLVKEWPHSLYSVKTIINAVNDILDTDKNNEILLQALAELYSFDKDFNQALSIYLKLKHKDVFALIQKHSLYDAISDNIVELMEFDEEQAIQMLIDNVQKIPIDKVVQQLEKKPKYQYIYLHKLYKKDAQSMQPYAGKQIKLYAEFDRKELLPFLRSNTSYKLDMALRECETREFYEEQVFLLGRMGNLSQALNLITSKLRKVEHAIDFCKEHNDEELWDNLISYSIDKPSFITGLLNSIGTHVDPIRLIKRIQTGMEIPGLRDSLVRIIKDYNLQICLRDGCRRILVADSFNLMARLVKTQKKAISVDINHICQTCQRKILVNDLQYASDITVYFCHHVFHDDCLPRLSSTCPICTTQKRAPGSKIDLPIERI